MYNALGEEVRGEYAQITGEFKHGLLTEFGLKSGREEILERVGCLELKREFKDLAECSKEFHEVAKKEKGHKKSFDELLVKYNELDKVLTDNGLVFGDN